VKNYESRKIKKSKPLEKVGEKRDNRGLQETHIWTEAQKEGEKAKDGGNEKKPASVASDSPASAASDVKDKISSVVVEEINREHLLIKGRKNVLFKNRKRMVEIQALVSRKDIGDDDTLNSDSILETNVAVVR
jgi:flagellar basal body L-ring protein FlgH